MNQQLVLIALGLVVAAFVTWPFWRGRRAPAPPRATPPRAKAPALSDELAELELDREMGRVSEEDYARWRAELEPVAPPAEPAVEVAVVAPPVVEDVTARAEALVRRWHEAPRPTCPDCGLRPEPDARFCSNCGASLAP